MLLVQYICDYWRKRVCLHNFLTLIIYNAMVAVYETAVYCRSLFGLQSPITHNFGDLIQNNRKCCKNIIPSFGLHG